MIEKETDDTEARKPHGESMQITNHDEGAIRAMRDYSTVGLMFPVSIAVGAAGGYFLDKWFKTAPYLLIIFTFYGIAAGFWNLYKVTRRNDKPKSGK